MVPEIWCMTDGWMTEKGKHSMGREFQSLVMEGKKHWA